ncbi:Protein of unknown function (DUF3176) domain containing protein, partial [Naviculisporaceae sp. PSN 640]
QELAEARAREILMGGPRVVSYGPAPPVEDRGVAPTEFSMPSLYPGKRDAPSPAQAYDATATISSPGMGWQLQSKKRSPFMHYEDIDYFGPEPDDTDLDSPDLETEQEKLKFAEAHADGLQMGVKARRSWGRQQRRQAKAKKQQHQHLDHNQPTSHSTPQSSNNQSLISDWLPEIIYLLVSMAVLVATFLTLRAFDGQSIDPSHWPISPSITLNTLIAFLTAICQLSLLIPITQGLAQLKWNWFARAAPAGTPVPGRERSLGDFGLFDDAAFGTGRYGGWSWGATRLLFSGKGRTLGVGACLVLLTGWLSGPFTQGTVGYRMGEYQDPGVSQRRAIQQGIHYHPYSYSTATTNTNDTSRPAIPLLPPLPPHCSTPSCQFPLFSSLAICVDTIDLSSQLTISNLSTASGRTPLATAFDFLEFMPDSSTTLDSIRNATLPNGAYLVGSRDTCNLNITSSSSLPRGRASGGDRRPVDTLDALFPLPTDTTTLGFNNQPDKLSAAIANFFIIYTNQTTSSTPNSSEETTFAAAEVLFHFCVNTYNVSVTQGVPTSEIVNST